MFIRRQRGVRDERHANVGKGTHLTPARSAEYGLVTGRNEEKRLHMGSTHRCNGCWGSVKLDGSDSPGITSSGALAASCNNKRPT